MRIKTALESAVDAVLIDQLSPTLKNAIASLVAKGAKKRTILSFVRSAAGGRRGVALAVEAYLEQLSRDGN